MLTTLTVLTLTPLLLGCSPKVPGVVEPEVAAFELPQPGPLPDFTPPAPEVRQLDSGAALWVVEDHQLPLVSVRIVLDGGARLDPDGQWGLTSLTAEMMGQSAGGRSAVELSKTLRLLAAELSIQGTRDSVEIALDVHADRLEEALALAADVALRPAFAEEDWTRVRTQRLTELRQRSEDGRSVAGYLAVQQYYGAAHPLGRAVDGTPASVEGLTLDDLRAAWARNAQAERATFVVVGDVDADALTAALDAAFTGWPEAVEPEESTGGSERPGAGKFLLVDLPGATQTTLRLVGDGYAPDDPDAPGARLAEIALGGSFTSRLNRLLRTEKGYTYGAWSQFTRRRGASTWTVSTSVRGDATAAALSDLLGVLEGAAEGYSDEEVEKARAQLLADAVSARETRARTAGTLEARARLRLPPEGEAAELVAARSAGSGDMRAATERYLDTGGMLVLLVGDRAAIASDLEAAGYDFEVIEEPE